mmetsp:Transcript_4685/g.7624  ORF Transcript_4685/g.7624 Transcript_4685/m.7624 type:complete len:163 (+) Transcript_4685:107-595(+)|eukprot:CAMPEP_0169128810 /NCGR_PEP_ID=MMETSP1015-20121227/36782_1 /TAXON_ID=342587 /ORGANISM="Karlodinium micrum, Strain CCMP2283" /LENGTH=162 /DNA_ID=CAMNT_0009192769 /DNA_START=87 /DNA_END=575 /DNA_ORIENTATION=-
MPEKVSEETADEVFKLFDQEGTGIKIKEMGTVMRSLGVAASEAQLKEFQAEALKKDKSYIQFGDFYSMVTRAQTVEAPWDAEKMGGMKVGLLHFFDKLPAKDIREKPPATVKINDLKHLLGSCGEKLHEEEIEELARTIRANCRTEDGRVDFEDFLNMLSSS